MTKPPSVIVDLIHHTDPEMTPPLFIGQVLLIEEKSWTKT